MGNTFNITSLLQSVDQLGQNYVSTAYQALASAATSGGGTGVAGLLLTLYVIFWGIGIWQGTSTGGPADHAFRLFRAMLIYAMATKWGDFQTLAYNFLNDGPSAIGNALLSAVTTANHTGTSANLNSVNGVQSALQNMWNTTNSATEAFLQNAGITNWGPYIFAAVFYVVMAILIGFAIFLIVLSKMFMWLLLALAPLFILLLLFGVTTRFFSGWLSALAQYFLVQVLVYAFLAFYVSLIQQTIDTLNGVANSKSATWATIGPVVLLAIIGILLLSQINNMAAALAGGVPIFAPPHRRGARDRHRLSPRRRREPSASCLPQSAQPGLGLAPRGAGVAPARACRPARRIMGAISGIPPPCRTAA